MSTAFLSNRCQPARRDTRYRRKPSLRNRVAIQPRRRQDHHPRPRHNQNPLRRSPLDRRRLHRIQTNTPTKTKPRSKSDELIAELLAANEVVISTPMYNFNVPAVLKAWIDHIVRLNKTFSFGPEGLKGLPARKSRSSSPAAASTPPAHR